MTIAVDGLLERQSELAAIAAAVRGAVDGAGSLVLVEGAAGIGKTRLLAHARAEAAAAGLRVLGARGSELESGVSFGVVRQLLDPIVLGERRADLFDGAAEGARSIFEPAPLPAGDDVFPRLHGLYWLLTGLARERPLTLLVDDAHWSDGPSLHLLAFLARRIDGLALTIVAAARPVNDPLLARIATDPAAHVLRPRPLSPGGVAAQAAGLAGAEPAPEFVSACHSASRGNPFLVGEILKEIAARGLPPSQDAARVVGELAPQGVAAVVLLRLAGMPPAARPIAEAVAVLGDGFSTGDALALAEVAAGDCEAAVSALVRGGILEHLGGLAFVHPVVRAAVYRDLSPPRRDVLHRRAAALIAAREAPVEEVAAHLLASDPAGDERTVETLRAAAARAVALGVPASALGYLERALLEPPPAAQRAEILLELGTAAGRCGTAGAAKHLQRAIELAPDPHARSRAALQLARAVKYTVGAAGTLPTLERCLEETPDAGLAEQLEIEMLCMAYLGLEARLHLRARISALRPPAEGATGPGAAFTYAALAFEAARSARSARESAELAARSSAAVSQFGDPAVDFTLLLAGAAALWADRYDDAERIFGRMMEAARRTGTARPISGAASMRAWLQLRRGNLADAEADARFAIDLAREVHGREALLGVARSVVALAAIERTPAAEGLEWLDAELEGDEPDSLPFPNVLHARGRLAAVRGRPAAALEDMLLAGRRHAAWDAACPAIVPWRSDAALLLCELGDRERALALADEEVALARRFGAASTLGIALRARALVGPREEVEPLLAEAVGVLEGSPARLQLARALVDLGAARRRSGERMAARAPLLRGAELAVRCGSERLAAAAQEELLASGARPRRIALKGVEALTPAERRVAQLAAGGRTNRQIAQELYVTEKTVEGHLARAYDKLGIRSRTSLPQALGEVPDQSESTV